ncbi:hypothetical protein AB833_02575 [Chromatiales bacterium (ex Bugula neritina AB1)]|nr:hypothetical protein AB833_02575 [Chromatiales bacterium (ex Bugula neritina AB1)]
MSPLYSDESITLKVRTINLLWKPLGQPVKFVLVDHPTRGKIILMCSDLALSEEQIIRLYGLRFKIEVTFKQASQVIGYYGYHFWMSTMKPTKRYEGTRYLHRESSEYRAAVTRKIHAYHVFLMMGVVAQGIMQFLSARYAEQV